MASLAAYNAIRSYLEANWAATPIIWDNERDEPRSPASTPAWVAVEMMGQDYGQASIGAGTVTANRWLEEGAVYISVMVGVGTGSRLAREHLSTIVDLFRGPVISEMEFLRSVIGVGEPNDDAGLWWRLMASIEWRRG